MATLYPTALDDNTSLPTRADGDAQATAHASDHNTLAGAVKALETKLGITAGTYDFSAGTGLYLPKGAAYSPPAEAAVGLDTTTRMFAGRDAIVSKKTLAAQLYAHRTASDTLSASVTTEQVFSNSYTFPANFFITDKIVRVTLSFLYSSAVTVPNMTIQSKLGGTNMWQSTSQTLTANTGTGLPFGIEFLLIGTAAPSASSGVLAGFLGSYAGSSAFAVSAVTTQPVNRATNGTLALTVAVTYAAVSAGNSLTLVAMSVQEQN